MATKKSFENAVRINRSNRTIEVTKSFDKAASRFGTREYEAMQQVRKDYSSFTVVVKTVRTKADHFKGLTYDFMEKYIKAHNADLLSEFYTLTGKDSNDEFAVSASYGEVRQWFLNQFDTFSRTRIDAILGKHAA